jgi:riboflavin synthase
MFTGLVHELGTVAAIESAANGGARLRVNARCSVELSKGDSVMVNGVCLTAVDTADDAFSADLSQETLDRSTLGTLVSGSAVNLELALRPQDRLGGHIVQGHVDGIGTVSAIVGNGAGRDLRINADPRLLRYVVEKGSVALDGVSLTVTAVDEQGFRVSLIPETLRRTNLTEASRGSQVNLEVDVISKYVEKLVAK